VTAVVVNDTHRQAAAQRKQIIIADDRCWLLRDSPFPYS
jgi:hypothetical protein